MKPYTELPITVADLEYMPDDGNRYEVIEGELYVASAPSYFHQFVLVRLIVGFDSYLQQNPIGNISPGVGVVFDSFSGVVPDLVYTSHERLEKILSGGKLRAAPEIAIEILSPGADNEHRDKVVKRRLYSVRGVHEYWIVDPEARTIEVSRKRKEGGLEIVATLQEGDDLTSPELPGFRLPVANLFK